MSSTLVCTLFLLKFSALDAQKKESSARSAIAQNVDNWSPNDEANVWEMSGLYEGDIRLPDGRNALLNETTRWPEGVVPYRIEEEDFDDEEIETIRKAIKEYHKKSCIRFRSYKFLDKNWIEVRGDEPGCWSSVGMQGGEQIINLQSPNCIRHGTIIHEFLHALGFYHQQSASNRDEYVKIHWENIQKDKEFNFNKYNESVVTDYGVGYDYDSVLHYSAKAFSKNNRTTIEALQPNKTVGQRDGFSEKDLQKLEKMYSGECASRKPKKKSDFWSTLLAMDREFDAKIEEN